METKNTNIQALRPKNEQEIIDALMYKGKIAAIKLYMKHANCRLRQAKEAVEKLSMEITPGQAW